MGYSILDLGNDTRKQALSGLREATSREQEREMANDNLKQAEQQKKMSAVGMGASAGMMAGMQAGAIGGPAGMAVVRAVSAGARPRCRLPGGQPMGGALAGAAVFLTWMYLLAFLILLGARILDFWRSVSDRRESVKDAGQGDTV